MRIGGYYNQKSGKKSMAHKQLLLNMMKKQEKPLLLSRKEKDIVAQQIIELAKENDIHMQEDSTLVANLLDMDLGDNIPPQLYSVMAEILLLIEEMDKKY